MTTTTSISSDLTDSTAVIAFPDGPTCAECESGEIEELDQIWAGPSTWERVLWCRECDRSWTTDAEYSGDLVDLGGGQSRQAKQVRQRYVDGDLSERALEESLDRVFGLDGGGSTAEAAQEVEAV